MIKFENRTNDRFYYLLVEKDLLNHCVLRIYFGGARISRCRVIGFEDQREMQKEIDRLAKKRLSRGYSLVT